MPNYIKLCQFLYSMAFRRTHVALPPSPKVMSIQIVLHTSCDPIITRN